jgi:replicative DNA helicase
MFRETALEGHGGKSMADVLFEYEIDILNTPDESVEWIMEELRARYLTKQANDLVKELSTEISTAASSDRADIYHQHVAEFVQVSLDLQSKRDVFNLGEDADTIEEEYNDRKANRGRIEGLQFGLPRVDNHTHGIKEGELAIIAAPPKGSKSYMLDRIALKEWEAGRTVSLFTLENSLEMTRDRIACLATNVHPERFEMGECDPVEEAAIHEWVQDALNSRDNKLWIVHPPLGERTIESMVTQAQIRQSDSIIIDQLSHVDPMDPKLSRPLQIREIMQSLKGMISTGHSRMSAVLAHQLTRDGIKLAVKNGFLHMYDLAEGSDVEKTADWVFSMYQSEDAKQVGQFLLQILAARRGRINNWDVSWSVDTGIMDVLHETDLQ